MADDLGDLGACAVGRGRRDLDDATLLDPRRLEGEAPWPTWPVTAPLPPEPVDGETGTASARSSNGSPSQGSAALGRAHN